MLKTASMLTVAMALGLAAGPALADKVHDWRDLDRAHNQILRSIGELERARAANHYDLAGHGAKAEELLRQAEKEIALGIAAVKASP